MQYQPSEEEDYKTVVDIMNMNERMYNSKEKINIVFCSDSGYFVPTYIAVFSLLYNYKGEKPLNIFLMVPDDYSEECVSMMKGLQSKFDFFDLTLIKMGDMYASAEYEFEHINNVAMYRLSIPLMLQHIDKCIYLDSDIVVEGDISELDGISIDGVCIAGVKDGGPLGEYAERLRETLDIPDFDQYINSGVLIMNLKEIREKNRAYKLQQADHNSNKYLFIDQDVLNTFFYDSIKMIPFRFNAMLPFLKYKDMTFYDSYGKEEQKMAITDPFVVHYISKRKPWSYKHMNKADRWWKYVNMQDEAMKHDYIEPFVKKHPGERMIKIKETIKMVLVKMRLL